MESTGVASISVRRTASLVVTAAVAGGEGTAAGPAGGEEAAVGASEAQCADSGAQEVDSVETQTEPEQVTPVSPGSYRAASCSAE